MSRPTTAGPLAHLRVVDCTDLRGALAGRMLADLGADVLKVEAPEGDSGRLRGPFAGGTPAPDRSLAFLYRNANKRGAVLDRASAAGAARFEALCAAADVLIENETRSDVRGRHPHLVHVVLSDFGASGPRAAWRLEPLPAFAASGALFASGFPERPPCWLPGYVAHDCASIVGVAGALAAILDRARHGLGQTIEVSVQEAALAALAPWAVPLADYAGVYPVLPATYPRDADGPALVVPTADGWVRLLALTPRQWRALVALLANREGPEGRAAPEEPHVSSAGSGWELVVVGVEALAQEARHLVGRAIGRLAHLPLPGVLPVVQVALGALRRLAIEAFANRSRADVLAHARRLGLPIAPVHTPAEFVAAEQTVVRGYFRRTGFPHLGDAPVAVFPCNLSATPATLRRPAPAPGEDDVATFPTRLAQPPTGGDEGPVLAGVRVVSLGVGAVVPELCAVLTGLGADVVKVESRAGLDFLRRLTPEPDDPDRSWMFNDENRGQRSVCLDLGTADGRSLALRLCAAADVVAENRTGGVVAGWRLDYDDVRRVRPDVVYASSQGYGRGGPLGEAPAFGPLNAAFAGIAWLWNHADAPYPAGSSLEHPDHLAGRLAAVAVLAALEHRRRTGEGQRIEMAQTEAAAYLLGELYLQGPCTGRPALPRGNAVDWACPHGVYPSAGVDRWCAIAVVGDEAWARFRRRVGWPRDPALDTLAGRLAVRESIEARVAVWTRSRGAEDAAAMLQDAGVSAMAVLGPTELRADPHLAARRALVEVDDPGVGPVRHVADPLRPGRLRMVPARPAPRLGAHTAEVLTAWLGLPPGEVDRLIAAGVCR